MSTNPNILVSGAGIAGTVFAFWLLRAHPNANITIVERDPALRLTGSSIDIRSSAVDIIKWMGVEQEIRNQSTKEEGLQFVRADGTEIGTFRATGRTDIQSITSEYEIHRGDLATIFSNPIADKVQLVFDEYVKHFDQSDDGVTVTFAKSKEVKKYDLLVAADGLNSKIRGLMLNTKPSEQLYDEGVHVAYFTIKKDLLNGGRVAKWYNAQGGRVIFLRPDPNPAGRTRCLLMNVTTKTEIATKERLNNAWRDGDEAYMKLMEEMFQDVGWLGPEVLKAMRKSDDFYCSLFGQVRAPKIHDGRVVLLGDAASATPGFGTSLAIIGAYVLAGELLKDATDVKGATDRYSGFMLPFAKSGQGSGVEMQYLNPQSQWGITIRNAIVWVVTKARLDKLAVSIAALCGFSESKVSMPVYAWPSEK